MTKLDDEVAAAIADCLRGDQDRFAVIVQRYQAPLYRYCYYFCLSVPEAEDAAVDIFIKVYRALPAFRAELGFSAWLFRIAHHHMVEAFRKKMRTRRYRREAAMAAGGEGGDDAPDERFFRDVAAEEVKKALADIAPKYREVLMLRYYQDLSYREIAEIMNLNKNTVASLILRGKKEIKRRYERLGGRDAMLR